MNRRNSRALAHPSPLPLIPLCSVASRVASCETQQSYLITVRRTQPEYGHTDHTKTTGLLHGVTYRAFDIAYVDAVWSERVVRRPGSRVEAARARRSSARAEPAPLVVVQAPPAPVVAHGPMAALRVAFAGEGRRWRCRNRWHGASPCTEEREKAVPVQTRASLRRVVWRRLAAPKHCAWER